MLFTSEIGSFASSLAQLRLKGFLVFVFCTPIYGSENPLNEIEHLTTGYNDRFGEVSIIRKGDGGIYIIHDPNHCTLDGYGDPRSCTRIAPRKSVVIVHEVSRKVIGDQVLTKYSLEGADFFKGFFLVHRASLDSRWHLVLNVERGVVNLPLF